MKKLIVKIESMEAVLEGAKAAMKALEAGKAVQAQESLSFPTWEALHRILTPKRLAIIEALAGMGTMSAREVSRIVDRDFKNVHTDIEALVNAGVIEKTAKGVEFPYDGLHLEMDIGKAA